MLFPSIKKYIETCLPLFDDIPKDRKKILQSISDYIAGKIKEGNKADLIYICTHNSRRSHLGQIWGAVAAVYYTISNVNTYSGGTETTAFHPNAIHSLIHAAFRIEKNGHVPNPVYSINFDNIEDPIICFSKVFDDDANPKKDFCAIMTCTEADGNCPFISGAEIRVSCPYEDPKEFDGTPKQEEMYAERCRQIAIENLYIFSLVNK